MSESPLNAALRHFEAAEANLVKAILHNLSRRERSQVPRKGWESRGRGFFTLALDDAQVLIFRSSEILDRVLSEAILISDRKVIQATHEHL